MIFTGVESKIRQLAYLIGWVSPHGISTCCICGGDEVLWVQEDFELNLTRGDFVIPNLIFQRCSACKETFLNQQALKRIQKATAETK